MSDISLYLDEDVRVLLAEVLRNRGYNASHVLEVGRTGKSDYEQLTYAARHKMAILTHNIRDYAILSKAYAEIRHCPDSLVRNLFRDPFIKNVAKLDKENETLEGMRLLRQEAERQIERNIAIVKKVI